MKYVHMKFESKILLVLWVAATFVIVDPQTPPSIHHLQDIVDDVRKEVYNHLKTKSGQLIELAISERPQVPKEASVENVDDIVKMIKESIHHHLNRNLNQHSFSKRDELTLQSIPTAKSTVMTPSTASTSDDFSESKSIDDDILETSSEVYEIQVGSARGVPGITFPDYTDIPKTSFTCRGKTSLPGFFADLDTGCQVFHVCWPDRRESFLCPIGTVFNQALLVCDYWYNVNCSLAPYYYTTNPAMEPGTSEMKNDNVSSMIHELLENANYDLPDSSTNKRTASTVASFISKFIPVKAKIVVYPETVKQRPKIVASASIGESNKADSKSRQKNLISKLSSVHGSKYVKPQTDTLTTELKKKIFAIRFREALENILTDVKKDESLSKLFDYVQIAVNFLKNLYAVKEPLDVKLDGELYEYDLNTRKTLDTVQVIAKKFLSFISWMYEDEYQSQKLQSSSQHSHKIKKREAVKHEEVTHLNPRFIIKPGTNHKETLWSEVRDKLPVVVKHGESNLAPLELKPKKRLEIYPGTKKTLLKNYAERYKVIRKR